MATVTSKGQITIPKRVRDALGIRAGTEIDFDVEGDSVRMRKADNRQAIDRWRGALDLGEPVDDFVDRLRGGR